MESEAPSGNPSTVPTGMPVPARAAHAVPTMPDSPWRRQSDTEQLLHRDGQPVRVLLRLQQRVIEDGCEMVFAGKGLLGEGCGVKKPLLNSSSIGTALVVISDTTQICFTPENPKA